MKKKFLVTALAGLSLACLFGGCSFNVTPPEEETKKPVRERVVTIADFETWETGIQLIRPSQYFGTIRLNTDTAYVKSGKEYSVLIDLKPALSMEMLDSRILRDFSELQNKDFSNSLDACYLKALFLWLLNYREL